MSSSLERVGEKACIRILLTPMVLALFPLVNLMTAWRICHDNAALQIVILIERQDVFCDESVIMMFCRWFGESELLVSQ